MMNPAVRPSAERPRSTVAAAVFRVLDPLPYGFFVAALIFDAIYADNGEILWTKAAAWLICFGLILAIIPRLINLVRVWVTGPRPRRFATTLAFWLNFLAIVAAIANALVHSRDAYASMPDGLWLSIVTVALLVIAHAALALHPSTAAE
jgi:uncharacterized membrane protein